MADLSALSDDYLDEMRTELKVRVSASRDKVKGRHIERQYECDSKQSDNRKYRVFTRQHAELPNVFSVGLCLVQPGGNDLILCRYNGDYHSHKNRVEGTKLAAGTHVHLATQRYIEAGLDADGYAFATDRFLSMEQALRCLVEDCGIEGILDLDAPENMTLF